MTRTQNTATPLARSVKAPTRARCTPQSSCRCGQQLDMCANAHCPRCGRSLRHD